LPVYEVFIDTGWEYIGEISRSVLVRYKSPSKENVEDLIFWMQEARECYPLFEKYFDEAIAILNQLLVPF
jgi:hypothetical protein